MHKISVGGLSVDAGRKSEILGSIVERLDRGARAFIITPYSEFLYAALRDPKLLDLLNKADVSVADGIAILWAAKYLSLPLRRRSYYAKIFEALWQMKYTLAAILFRPSYICSVIPEKITGVDMFLELSALAVQRGQSIYLLGGFGDTTQRAAEFLQRQYPDINIARVSSKNPDDPIVIDEIKQAKPDFLFVAYGPIKQEQWIAEHWHELGREAGVKLAIGLGGTFDYIAGKLVKPPQFVRKHGWEWLFRLLTQPQRMPRIINATFGLLQALLRYKVFMSLSYRQNVVPVIINDNNQVLICKRNYHSDDRDIGDSVPHKFDNYWQLPQGGVDRREDIVSAARREAAEEVGLKNLELLKISERHNVYFYAQARRPLFFNSKLYCGQDQTVVYFRHLGPDNAVRVDYDEVIDYRWVAVSELENAVHLERGPLARIVVEEMP